MNWGSTAPLFIVSLSTSCPPASQGSVGVNSFPHLPECRDELDVGFLRFGYGSIPINTIFRGMNIHLPVFLMFTRGNQIMSGKNLRLSWTSLSSGTGAPNWKMRRALHPRLCSIRKGMKNHDDPQKLPSRNQSQAVYLIRSTIIQLSFNIF
jgi:hypothetical protein